MGHALSGASKFGWAGSLGDLALPTVNAAADAPTESALTPAEVAAFHDRGVVRVEQAFPHQVALEVQDVLWCEAGQRLGVRRDDPDSWPAGGWGTSAQAKSVTTRVQTARLSAALDQLLGPGGWRYPRRGGGLLVGAPEPGRRWTLTDRAWHWDGDQQIGATMFCVFADVGPRSGGTLLVEGSGRLLLDWYRHRFAGGVPDPAPRNRELRPEFLAADPWLRRLSGRDPVPHDPDDLLATYDDERGHRLRVTEVTGRAGDVFVCHSNLLHASPVHTGSVPRFLAVRAIDTRPPTGK